MALEGCKDSVSRESAPVHEGQGGRRAPTSDFVRRAVVDPDALSYHLLRPGMLGPTDLPLIGEAYRCWSEVWHETFTALKSKTSLPSDDFTRQQEVGAVFHGYECVALSFFRWVDLSNPIYRDDSYFSIWPEDVRDAACARGSKICVSSYFTLSAPWRRATGCSLKDILGALIVERFLLSDADTLVGTMRTDRGMGRLANRLGSQTLREGVIHHGVEVDLIAFYRNDCTREKISPSDEAIVQTLRPTNGAR